MKPVGEEPPEPEPVPIVEPEPEEEEEEEDERAKLINAHRAVFLSLCGRIRRKEAKALRRELRDQETFYKEAQEFYLTHAGYMADTLTPAISAYSVSLGGEEVSRSRVLEAMPEYGAHDTQEQILKTPLEKRRKIVAGIEDNAEEFTEKILNYWSNGHAVA
jgi:hypothetical protein